MNKFDMGSAWADTLALLSSNKEAIAIIGGLLIAVPFAVFLLFASQSVNPEQIQPDITPAQLAEVLLPLLWPFLLALIASQIGSLTISRLLLAEGGTTVGQALRFGAIFMLVAVAAQLVVALALQLPQFAVDYLTGNNASVSMLMTVVMIPVSIYIGSGRLFAATPVIAARGLGNPIKALSESWRLTTGNGWRIGIFVTLVIILLAICLFLAALVFVLILLVLPTSVGGPLLWIPLGFIFALYSVFATALAAAIYRQLAGPSASSLAEEFE